jgi:hypothetical protein
LELKRNIISSSWPQYDFLGDFHTHPEKDHEKVSKKKLYYFSKGDFDDIQNGDWKNHNYKVGIIMTIAQMKKRSSSFIFPDPGTVCFTVEDYKIWIKAYIAYQKKNKLECSDHKDRKVSLLLQGNILEDNKLFP